MSKVVNGLYYSKDHEWVMAEGSTARIGVTDHAQEALGDVVYVEINPIGSEIKAGDALGTVESVKAASDVISPVSGKITAVNESLDSQSELVNADPYENYFCTMEMSDVSELDGLMDAAAYTAFCGEN